MAIASSLGRRQFLGLAAGLGTAAMVRAEQAVPLFDSYAHVVSPDRQAYPPLPLGGEPLGANVYKDPVEAADLIKAMDRAGVARACLIHRAFVYGYDNRLVEEAAKAFPDRLRFVPVVDPEDAGTLDRIRRWHCAGLLGGVRVLGAHHDTGIDWIDTPAALTLYREVTKLGLTLEMELYPTNNATGLMRLIPVLEANPRAIMVVDNVAVPEAKAPDFGLADAWLRAARTPNLLFKIATGNFTRLIAAGADPALFMRRIVDLYGADRLMWGSDQGQTAGGYDEKIALARAAVAKLSPAEQRRVLHDTGERLFWPKRGRATC